MRNDPSGSVWRQWDLHFHTPSSFDYQDKSVTNRQIVEGLIRAGISAVAITDHHTIDVDRIKNLQALAGDSLTVFPGIELRSELGGSDSVHYIGIFSENSDFEGIWAKLQGKLEITPQDVLRKGDDFIYVPFELGVETIHSLGGIVTVHAGKKSNSIEEIGNQTRSKMEFKKDLAEKHIDIFEIGQIADVASYKTRVFPAIGLSFPLIMASDNHNINAYSRKMPCWIKADITFRGLCHVLCEPEARVFLGSQPPSVQRVLSNRTKYIQSISLRKVEGSTLPETWFDGHIPLNPGFVAIVGNKGSGKSALADIIGLLADSGIGDSFSFLCDKKFRQAKTNKSEHFEGEIAWVSGRTSKRCLSEEVDGSAIESVKYVPQSYLEDVCNELGGSQPSGFSRELRAVIFSHVEETDRLGHKSLDDLLAYRTEETTEAIGLLTADLKDKIKRAIDLEALTAPEHRKLVENQLTARRSELDAHQASKPEEVPKPQDDFIQRERMASTNAALSAAEVEIQRLDQEIASLTEERALFAKRGVAAERLLARIANLHSQVATFEQDSQGDCALLELELPTFLTFEAQTLPVENKKREASIRSAQIFEAIGEPSTSGLLNQRENEQRELVALRDKLDEPNKKYQQYLADLKQWEDADLAILGTESTAGSVKCLEAELAALDALPSQLGAAWTECLAKSIAIHREVAKLVEAHRATFRPVQRFIEEHPLSKDRFDLRFNASIAPEDFEERFLENINKGRKGSFCGSEEGRERLRAILAKASFDSEQGISEFLENLRSLLSKDHRQQPPEPVRLIDQLAKGKTPSSICEFLFGLSYLKPRISLRWAGKEIEQLSPGERGTLLLVFYLLIDRSDVPLVIDQPEENLDNHTVVDFLVPSIKEAKARRQIVIVTHNPNLAVVCDADQIIYASMNKNDANRVTYTTGAIENPEINKRLVDILEGTRPAFDNRDGKYQAEQVSRRRRFLLI